MTPPPLPAPQQALLEQGFALHAKGQLKAARDLYRRIEADDVSALRLLGTVEHQLGDHVTALPLLDRSLAIVPGQYEVWLVKGDALTALKKFPEAVACYDQALVLHPRYPEAYVQRGNALRDMDRFDDAIGSYGKALLIRPDHPGTLLNRGNVYLHTERFELAVADLARAFAVQPDLDWLEGQYLHVRMHICEWSAYDDRLSHLLARVAKPQKATAPFTLHSLVDSLSIHQAATEFYMHDRFPAKPRVVPPRPAHDRIRIAYVSSDFRNHPVSHLLAGLFEHHDRTRFEVFAIFSGNTTNDGWRDRIRAAADRFIDIASLSNEEVVTLFDELGIDIAVDLNGFTGDARPDLFARRAAPVQVNYIGYLGTMGMDYYDYVLADRVIIPDDSRKFYNEKVARMPSFQVNDDKPVITDRTFSRADLGLPEEAFVFCSFNQAYKINPEVFAGWMRILTRAPGSVLWLFVKHPGARERLKAETERHGVDPERLIFAPLAGIGDHMARQRAADLFLDTHPYNAGATASGALRMGLPVLTRIGESFAARMGASLLTAVGLPELIVETAEAYETLAVELAKDPARMATLKAKLLANAPGSLLFDTVRATRSMEAAFAAMRQRAQNGLSPDHIDI